MPNVIYLNLAKSHHHSWDLPNMFSKLQKLQYLDLSYTNIHQIPADFLLDYPDIKSFSLRGLNIAKFNVKLIKSKNLEFLDISEIGLTHLSEHFTNELDLLARSISHNVSINLNENPLVCNCDNIYFMKWLSETKVIFEKEKLTCIYNNSKVLLYKINMNSLKICKEKG